MLSLLWMLSTSLAKLTALTLLWRHSSLGLFSTEL